MKSSVIIIVLILFFIDGCIPERTYENNVKRKLKDFPNSLITHFPIKFGQFIEGYSYPYMEGSEDNFGKSIYVLYHISDNDLFNHFRDSIDNKYSRLAYGKTYSFYSDRSIYSFQGVVIYNDSVPIPMFVNIEAALDERDTIIEKLPQDFSVYILETRKGKFLPDSLLIKDNIVPSPWEHGMSRGVAISEERQKAIVWLSLW